MNEQLTAICFIDLDLEMAYLFALAPEEIKDFHVAIVVFRPPKSFTSKRLFGLHTGLRMFPRKEVIQPHLPVRLPCYDFTPVTNPALGRCSQMVSSRTSGVVDFHGVTGGVYKTRERIQRSVLICVY